MKNIGRVTKKYVITLNELKKFNMEIDKTYISSIKQGAMAGLIGALSILSAVILWLS